MAALLAGGSVPAGAADKTWSSDLHLTASATATEMRNISRTSDQATRKNATTHELSLSVSEPRQLTRNWLLEVSAGADWLNVPKYSLTRSFTVGPRVGLQRKFGLGPLAPVLRFDAAYTYKSARLNANTGWTAEAGVRVAKRLHPALKVGASAQWLEHYAESATFDIQQRTVSIDATWDISDRWRLSASAGRLSGKIVANAAWSVWQPALAGAYGSKVADCYNSIPWEFTHLYGPNWVSYNVVADADLLSCALSFALSDRTSLEARGGSVFVVNKIGVRYPTESWGLSLVHRF